MRRSVSTLVVLLLAMSLVACAGSSSTRRSGSARTANSGVAPEMVKAADINVQLAIGYLSEGRVELALEKIDRALEQNPKSASAHSVAGVINEQIGRVDQAEEYYRRSVRLEPDNGDLQNNYGQFLCKTGQYDQAMEHFQRAIEQPFYETPEMALGNACFCGYKADLLDEADANCRAAIDSDPEYGDAYYLLSLISLKRENPLSARAFLQRYQSVAPDTPASLKLCIEIETTMKDEKAARDCELRLKRDFPDSTEARGLEEGQENG